jgi:hypothetical protein
MKIEVWDTRYGTSVRVVSRKPNGNFVNNKSDKQIVEVILAVDDAGLYDQPTSRQQAMANHPAGKGRKR